MQLQTAGPPQVVKQQAISAGLVTPLTARLSSSDAEVRTLSVQALTQLAQALPGRLAMRSAGSVPALAAACGTTEAAIAALEVGAANP